MALKYITKGKGKSRKVIPIKNKFNLNSSKKINISVKKTKYLSIDLRDESIARLNTFIKDKLVHDIDFDVQSDNQNDRIGVLISYESVTKLNQNKFDKSPKYMYRFISEGTYYEKDINDKIKYTESKYKVIDKYLFVNSNYEDGSTIIIFKCKL